MWTYQNFVAFLTIMIPIGFWVSSNSRKTEWNNRIKKIERGIK